MEGNIALGRKTAYSLRGGRGVWGSMEEWVAGCPEWSYMVYLCCPEAFIWFRGTAFEKKGYWTFRKVPKKCLKQLQDLPDNTSSSACLALLGILPMESILHKNLLNIFVSMIRQENSVEL